MSYFVHGLSRDPIFAIWRSMLWRVKFHPHYAGRGIKVCERWHKYENFLADMGERPKRTSLDRIDNDGDYEPGNCRWATSLQQTRNYRRNRIIEFCGQRKTVTDWAIELGIPVKRTFRRLKDGWSISDALMVEKNGAYHRTQK